MQHVRALDGADEFMIRLLDQPPDIFSETQSTISAVQIEERSRVNMYEMAGLV